MSLFVVWGDGRFGHMKNANMFIYVSGNGMVYDRSGGKNNRLEFNTRFRVGNGIFIFMREGTVTIVKRYSENNSLSYKKELKPQGMYLLAPTFSQLIPKTPKEIRYLHSKIREVLGKANFKFEEDGTLEKPYLIRLYLNFERGEMTARFTIKINPTEINGEVSEEVYNLMTEVMKLDFKLVMKNINTAKNTMYAIITVDENFIATQRAYEKLTNRKLDA